MFAHPGELSEATDASRAIVTLMPKAKTCSVSLSAATLSGLLPERAKETSNTGGAAAREVSGAATRSVVAMACTRIPSCRVSAGARHSPMHADVPAPVRTI